MLLVNWLVIGIILLIGIIPATIFIVKHRDNFIGWTNEDWDIK